MCVIPLLLRQVLAATSSTDLFSTQEHPSVDCELRRGCAADVLAARGQDLSPNVAKMQVMFKDQLEQAAATGTIDPAFYVLLQQIGSRILVHSGFVEGANNILKHVIASCPHGSHQLIASRAGLRLQTSPTCANFGSERGENCDTPQSDNEKFKWSKNKEAVETMPSMSQDDQDD